MNSQRASTDVGWCCRVCGLAASQNPLAIVGLNIFLSIACNIFCFSIDLEYLEYYVHNNAFDVQFFGGNCATFLHIQWVKMFSLTDHDVFAVLMHMDTFWKWMSIHH